MLSLSASQHNIKPQVTNILMCCPEHKMLKTWMNSLKPNLQFHLQIHLIPETLLNSDTIPNVFEHNPIGKHTPLRRTLSVSREKCDELITQLYHMINDIHGSFILSVYTYTPVLIYATVLSISTFWAQLVS